MIAEVLSNNNMVKNKFDYAIFEDIKHRHKQNLYKLVILRLLNIILYYSQGFPHNIRSILPKSLFSRFLMITIIPLIIIQLVTTYIFYERHWESLTRNMANTLAGDVALLTTGITNVAEDDRESIVEAAKNYLDLDAYIDEQGEFDLQNDISSDFPDFINNIRARVKNEVALFKHGPEKYRLALKIDKFTLNIIFPNKRIANPTSYIFIMWVVGSAIIMILLSVGFLRGQVRSIVFLSKAAESFGKGREMRSFKPSGAKEIRLAGIAFIEMKERIRRLINSRTQTLVQVSSDLKTLIAKTKDIVATMGESKQRRDIEMEIDEMQHIIEGYMQFTLMEAPDHHVESITQVDLRQYFEKLITKHSPTPNTKIKVEMNDGIIYNLRPDYFARAVNNLIDNSLKYSKNILIRAQKEDNKFVHIFIDDDGEGIPEGKIEKVFQPFYRLDLHKHKETSGVGLGLTIARDVIHKHGGDIKLSKSHLGGLRATISLPY